MSQIRVRYLTPTELKTEEGLADQPEFPILFSRARDRIATLRAVYGVGPLAIDFRGMGDRSRKVEMISCNVRHVAIERRSSRTGQTHPLGGFIGKREYQGDLAEFVPYLRAAEWTGVGRQTVWGKGEIACDVFESAVIHCGKVPTAKWRNWQTHQTQNLALFTQRVGSTPTFATNK